MTATNGKADQVGGDPVLSRISIGQLAARTGVSSRTIRYYEELGILPEPPRSNGGTRKYGPEYRFYIEGAIALKELGFTLEEVVLVGRLALGLPMTKRQERQAGAAIRERMQSLERKVTVLHQLRDVLRRREAAGGGVPRPRAARRRAGGRRAGRGRLTR